MYHALPFSGGPDAPVVASVQYRCAPIAMGGEVQVQIVITDPQGPADLTDPSTDHLGMFPTDPPSGIENVVDFSFEVGSGVHWQDSNDVWGGFLDQVADPNTYAAICAAPTWPMDILVSDNSGHVTLGLLRGTQIDY